MVGPNGAIRPKHALDLAPGATASDKDKTAASDEEIVRFASMTFVGPSVEPGPALGRAKAQELAAYYRDEFLHGAAIEYDRDDQTAFYFKCQDFQLIVVSKRGDRISQQQKGVLRYLGSGMWSWRTGDE